MDRNDALKQEVLNRLAAIQAAAEILHDNDEMPRDERHLFLEAISEETTRLAKLMRRTCWPAAATTAATAH